MALTNEQGGRQLGRFILYYSLALTESAVCCVLWNLGMAGSGDFFEVKVSGIVVVVGGDGSACFSVSARYFFLFSYSSFLYC